MFYMILPSGRTRDALIQHLKSQRILSVFHYGPLHLSEMGIRHGGFHGQCPVTEDLGARLIRLPFYNDLSEADPSRVMESVIEFQG